jgi:hypothetical protein
MATLQHVLSNTIGGRRFLKFFCRFRDVFAEFERAARYTYHLMEWGSLMSGRVMGVARETNVKYIQQQLGHGNICIMLDLYSYLLHPSTSCPSF